MRLTVWGARALVFDSGKESISTSKLMHLASVVVLSVVKSADWLDDFRTGLGAHTSGGTVFIRYAHASLLAVNMFTGILGK